MPFQRPYNMERKWRRGLVNMKIPEQENDERDREEVYQEMSVAVYAVGR